MQAMDVQERLQQEAIVLATRLRATEATCQSLAYQLHASAARQIDLERAADAAEAQLQRYASQRPLPPAFPPKIALVRRPNPLVKHNRLCRANDRAWQAEERMTELGDALLQMRERYSNVRRNYERLVRLLRGSSLVTIVVVPDRLGSRTVVGRAAHGVHAQDARVARVP